MAAPTSPTAHRRTLVRACLAGVLAVFIGVGACTTSAPLVPPVPPGNSDLPPTPTPMLVGVSGSPSPSGAPTPTPGPTTSPGPSPTPPAIPSATVSPAPVGSPGESPSRGPTSAPTQAPATANPTPRPDDPSPTRTPPPSSTEWQGRPGKPATRIVISGLRIDLPVIAGDHRYPKCDVAQYLTSPFVSPGVAGSTYIYGHARRGMLLPMLDASKRNNGAEMLGMRVDVYTSANARYVYEIFRVKRHTRDFSLALSLKAGEHRLVVQTSEGPSGAYPKLQVAARLKGIYQATRAQAQPTPRPRTC